jgi:toxin ParE1/3/4
MKGRGRVIIREAAQAEIDEIARDLARRGSIQLGLRFYEAVDQTFSQLASMPRLGRRRIARDTSLADLRSWSIKGFRNHIVFYLPTPKGIEVLHVIHGARDTLGRIGVE